MSSVSDLYSALQQFRAYVEANMPYKETVYFGTANPTSTSTPANIGAMYFQTNSANTIIQNVYYKASTGNTDWLAFGSGGSSPSSSISNTAGLDVLQDVNTPENLNFTLLNAEGGTISLANPLNLYFQNYDLNTEKGFFQTISLTAPITFALTPTATLGATQNTVSKLYVYVGIKVSDPLQKIVALKVNSRLDTTKPTTVYDFRNPTQLKDRTYANLATSSTSDNYRLKLISTIDLVYTSGVGWQTPQLVTPYLPELDIISDKLLTDSVAGVPLRQQLNSLNSGTATLKDLQIFYNNLSVQTYTEINNTKEILFSTDTVLNSNDFKQYYAFILKPSISGLTFSVPNILEQKSTVIKNSGDYNLTISYSSPAETVVIEPNEIVNLVFCGTSSPTTPKILNLTNKPVPNNVSLRASYSSGLTITAKHPNGSNLSATNYVKIDLPSYVSSSNTAAEMDIQTFKFISNLSLTIPVGASLGVLTSSNYPQPVHVYFYNSVLGQGIAVCGNKKLYQDRTYSILAISASSQAEGQLYSSVAVSNASIKYIGYINFNYFAKTINGVSLVDNTPYTQLENIADESYSSTYMDIVNNDSVYTGFRKLSSNDNWLRILAYSMQDTPYSKRINLSAPVDGTVDFNLNFTITYSASGFPVNLGQRYSILDFPSPKTIGIYTNANSLLYVADVISTDVTLKWFANNGTTTISQTLLLQAGKRYTVWVAGLSEFPFSDITSNRLRIVSKYPEDVIPPQNITKNYKTLNLSAGSYTAAINDALIFSNNNVANFSVTLPNTSVVGSKVYAYFLSVSTAYNFTYSIFRSSAIPFYQTIEDSLIVNNGGCYLEFEYTVIGGSPFWFITYLSYGL